MQGAHDAPPEPLDAAILFAPIGELVRAALEALDRGGRLSIAGIHLTDVPSLNYERHLFQEREIASVTANTRDDAREFLALRGRDPSESERAAISGRGGFAGPCRPCQRSSYGCGGASNLAELLRGSHLGTKVSEALLD